MRRRDGERGGDKFCKEMTAVVRTSEWALKGRSLARKAALVPNPTVLS
jgi:hypothetical protein